jgi:4-amino-4-deoxy-L-arabinose transferase-like glycosyltransferase
MAKTEKKRIIILILVIALLLRLSIAWQPVSVLVQKVLVDDSLYGYAVAKNIAIGNGLTYNGIDPTNGFQPLWIFMISPVFLLTDDLNLAINIIYTLLAIIDVLNIFLIYLLARKIFNERVGLIASFLWAINPFIIFQTLCGLEVTIYITFVLASLLYYHSVKDNLNPKNMALLGMLLGLTFLARGDGLFLFIVIGAHALIYRRKRPDLVRFISRELPIYMLVALVVVSPWLIWSYLTFGTIQESSQLGKYYLAHGYFRFSGPAIGSEIPLTIEENAVRVVGSIAHQLGIIELSISLGTVVLVIFGILALFSFVKNWKRMLLPIVFSLIVLSFYVFYLWGVQLRYIAPIMPFVIIFMALGISSLPFNKKIVFLLLILISGVYLFNGMIQWDRGYGPWQIETVKEVQWMDANIASNEIVGSFSSGIPIYFSNHTIIQLDGIMNFGAIDAMLNKSMYTYMKSRNITIWFDGTLHCYDKCQPCYGNCVPPFYANDSQTLSRWHNDGFDVVNENMWMPVFDNNSFEVIRNRCGVYHNIRGFDFMDCFFIMKVI